MRDSRGRSGNDVSEFKLLENLESRELTNVEIGAFKGPRGSKYFQVRRFADAHEDPPRSPAAALRLLKYTDASPYSERFSGLEDTRI